MTVGTVETPETVSSVSIVGPIPRIPSKPSKPDDLEATPIDWPVITSEEESVTVSVSVYIARTLASTIQLERSCDLHSVPEKEPEP